MKVSIIVPIYNSELYLTECIDSILNQDFTDWELLLIDDGSSDLSGKICDSFASKDRRVRVFHRENSGVSVARNWGIFQAAGDYICFIDSDDMVTPDYLSSFWKDTVNTDLYMQGYQIVNDDKRVQDIVSFGEQGQIITKNEASVYMYAEEKHIFNSPWAKLFKRQIIVDNQLQFDSRLSFGEDHIFSLQFLLHVQTLAFVKKAGYLYVRRNQESLTSGYIPHNIFICYVESSFSLRKKNCENLSIKDERFLTFIEVERNVYILRAILSLICDEKLSHERRNEILDSYLNALNRSVRIYAMPGPYKILLVICELFRSPFLIPFLRVYLVTNEIRLYFRKILR